MVPCKKLLFMLSEFILLAMDESMIDCISSYEIACHSILIEHFAQVIAFRTSDTYHDWLLDLYFILAFIFLINRKKLRQELLEITTKHFQREDEYKNQEKELMNQLLECSNALSKSITLLKRRRIDVPKEVMVVAKKYCITDDEWCGDVNYVKLLIWW